jgi:hypothetical protein
MKPTKIERKIQPFQLEIRGELPGNYSCPQYPDVFRAERSRRHPNEEKSEESVRTRSEESPSRTFLPESIFGPIANDCVVQPVTESLIDLSAIHP